MTHLAIRIGLVTSLLWLVPVTGCKKSAPSDDSSGAQTDQAATAGPARREHHKMLSFTELDKNHDGQLTADEAGDAWKDLSKADSNNDGVVTKQELGAFHPQQPSN
jgi:hypothetical protein